jgi:Flp pilus assembly protein TadG
MNHRGSLTIEFAILVPTLMLLFGVIMGGARTWMARTTVEQMAGAAARSASLERTSDQAVHAAERLAATQAQVGGLRCHTLRLDVDAAALGQPVGSSGDVQVTVHCDVPLADILVPGWPGTMPVSATATAVVDRYRGRK